MFVLDPCKVLETPGCVNMPSTYFPKNLFQESCTKNAECSLRSPVLYNQCLYWILTKFLVNGCERSEQARGFL